MNEFHLQMLSSPAWAEMLERELLPWIDRVAVLGDDVLEIGPGPGLSTDLLRRRATRITALELDEDLHAALATRLADTNIDVVRGSATRMHFPDGRFSAVCCFGVLHHVPSADEQDTVLREACRVLRPGASLLATDALADDEGTRAHHEGDTFVPLPTGTLTDRLVAAGFGDVRLDTSSYELRVAARRPRVL